MSLERFTEKSGRQHNSLNPWTEKPQNSEAQHLKDPQLPAEPPMLTEGQIQYLVGNHVKGSLTLEEFREVLTHSDEVVQTVKIGDGNSLRQR